ncbi:cellulose biosynthesis protein BcsC [Pseudomonas sp. C27(2019)]|uniref:cellulose synthase complex outer membrane protein BcsC n=1 Tax=Pseudomonas sp. C27(2019) TaxID=2604941 RepID=UPI00124848DE|nr:cellulose synthase complex outer membrane protein BcsC [Pseudomonas sp. C27(2019)]QEY57677.1 cellulose biosynthesis protein BcsC [Pseudomonas sp. C27(2019)]QEY60327.1 cellulose biosynthesis protein BcsC [Pseudomonas sp. C27(2019)]
MNKFSLNIAFCILLGTGYTQAVADPLAVVSIEKNMLEQIQLGEAMFRDDIVRDALARLYRVHPHHVQGLLAELRLAVRLDNLEQAQILLIELKKVAPDSEPYKQGALLLKLTEPEMREQLAQARLYAAAGRFAKAQIIFDELLQGYYPSADMAVEYWHLRTQQTTQRPLAIKALTGALQTFPKHPSLLKALINYHFQENNPAQALQYLHVLAEQKAQRDWAASREYEYLITLPVSSQTRSLWAIFVNRYMGLEAEDKGRNELERQTALLADGSWQAGQAGLRLLDQGRNPQAIARLKKAIAAYPEDVELHGALGLAYLRQGERERALKYFHLAKEKEQRADETSKWISLIASTEYWLLLNQASEAFERQEYAQAQRLYQQAHRHDADNIFALIGLADTALAMQQPNKAWPLYKRALKLEPYDETAQRGVLRYIATLPAQQAVSLLAALSPQDAALFVQTKRSLQIELLEQSAASAEKQERWQDQVHALKQIQQLNLADPWVSYRLALALREQGHEAAALEAYELHLSVHQQAAVSRYAHGLLLAAADRWDATLETLNAVPKQVWTQDMHNLAQRVTDARLIDQAQQHYDNGERAQAFALLEAKPQSQAARLQLARWAYEQGDYTKSLAHYTNALRTEPDNIDVRLGVLENWAAQGKTEQVRMVLRSAQVTLNDQAPSVYRRQASLWSLVGEKGRAREILQQQVAQLSEPDALLYRDLARLTAEQDVEQALDLYAYAMRDTQLLPAEAVSPQRDNIAFTKAMRESAEDDWLARGLRAEAEQLYLRETPTFTLHNDSWWRTDGTPGMSKLNANTTMAHLEFPFSQGRAFLRADHVRMDTGTLKKTDGSYSGRFGSCSFAGGGQSLAGCQHGLTQKADGTSFAAGWYDEKLSFDLGTTPYGFTVQNWAGGISYTDKIGLTGWRLTASRRPLSNSLLSFAGAKDPRTGTEWGGVMANGAALGLSWDQGGANGVWADFSHHQLSGKNVADNYRTRLMAGYYRRLINNPNERLTLGISGMLWRYQKDLGEYTLGQGGYYSPQRYTSLSLPVSYARRTADWSYVLEGSLSVSQAKTHEMDYYPIRGLIAEPLQELAGLGVSDTAFMAANRSNDGSSSGVGYSIRGFLERRLNNHWVLGTGLDWQYSEDYSPSRAVLYLRYSFAPWQGNLKLPVEPLTPYADFK